MASLPSEVDNTIIQYSVYVQLKLVVHVYAVEI